MRLDLNQLSEVAKRAAILAGEVISKQAVEDIIINKKQGGENIASQVVTQVDLMAQETIIETLKPTLRNYELGLLSEESLDDNSRFEKDYFWCIDPLDGTLAFSQNQEGYSVSISLIQKNGNALLGVVYDPRNSNLYSAIKNQGAYKNEKSFVIKHENKHLTLLYDQSFLKMNHYQENIKILEEMAKAKCLNGLKHHHLGGAVMNGISTIELAPTVYYKYPKKSLGGGSIWDFAASSVIQSEAKGHNSSFDGNTLHFNQRESTFMNEQGVFYASSKELFECFKKWQTKQIPLF